MTSEWDWMQVCRDVSVALAVAAVGWFLTLLANTWLGSPPSAAEWFASLAAVVGSLAFALVTYRSSMSKWWLAGLVLVLASTTGFALIEDAAPYAAASGLESAIDLARAGHTTEAIEALTRLVNEEPTNVPAMANLCGFELQAGRFAAAQATCRRAVALAPSNWLAQYNSACALAVSAQPHEALAALKRALTAVESDLRAGLTRAGLAQQARVDTMLRTLHELPEFQNLTR